MSNYYPQTSYERETILNIASVIVYCKNIGTVDQRIAYHQEVYLKERYGDNPLADNVPEYFKRMYNTAKHRQIMCRNILKECTIQQSTTKH